MYTRSFFYIGYVCRSQEGERNHSLSLSLTDYTPVVDLFAPDDEGRLVEL